jgi:hypothetical protein
VDAAPRISVFLLSKEHLEGLYPGRSGMIAWSMSPNRVKEYMADASIRTLEFRIESENW